MPPLINLVYPDLSVDPLEPTPSIRLQLYMSSTIDPALRSDVRAGTWTTPDFALVTRLTQFVEMAFASSDQGRRLTVDVEAMIV